jgi:hypothetical protein
VEQLAQKDLPDKQQYALKEELWGVLSPEQVQKNRDRRKEIEVKVNKVSALPEKVTSIIERYTGITTHEIREQIDVFLAWCDMRKPGNSAEELHETMKRI